MTKTMMMQWMLPVGLIFIGLLVGLIFEKVILNRLMKISLKTKWAGDEIIIRALRGSLILGFIIAGIYGASLSIRLSPSFLNVIHKILEILVIFTATLIASKIVSGLLELYMSHEAGLLPSASILTKLAKAIVFGLGILIALQALGISITPILTALGVGGLAVALALQDTLSNLFSGLQIIASHDIKLGDYVKLSSGEEGQIVDIAWRNTSIRALPNNMIIVPNAKLASAIITNFHRPDKELSFSVDLKVDYRSDLARVEQICMETAVKVLHEVQGGAVDCQPSVRFKSFGESGIDCSVGLRAREFTDQFLLKHEFIKEIQKRFATENIKLPFPGRGVYLKKTKQEK